MSKDKGQQQGGHVRKQKLTKKELKAQNHAKLMDMRKQKAGGAIAAAVTPDQLKKAA